MRYFIFLALLGLFINFAHAEETKVYSAEELQKIAESIFRGLNPVNTVATDEVEILSSPIEIKRDTILQKIEKAMNRKNDNEVNNIFKMVQQASNPPKVSSSQNQETVSASQNLTVADDQHQNMSPSSENTTSEPQAISTNKTPEPELPSLDASPRRNSRLDSWLRRNNQDDKTPNVDAPTAP